MQKICLIGASGFVGTNLIALLGSENCYNLDKKQSVMFPEITKIQDIRDRTIENSIIDKTGTVILLAAEHRDDVSPVSLYYDVNVQGTRNVLEAIDKKGIKKIIFTSSVAVYGLNKIYPDEIHPPDPFNHYGKSKLQAENVLREWFQKEPENRSLTIIRPTVIFGERNRGNVYALLKQIASGRFIMIGNGKNKKSMAYVGNVAAFIKHCLDTQNPGYRIYNYVDVPDMMMNELVKLVESCLGRRLSQIRLPFWLGYFGSLGFDLISKITGIKMTISSIRVKKFCATTQYNAKRAYESGFIPPFTLIDSLKRTINFEFIEIVNDGEKFYSE